ncbi:FxsB family cyclophane-forming radical SAM/SPASM peptide maturase [Streptomyces europaeiscabiei]|uniref:FxsB family radical SAM/SPASM domain protein n=4 Tax=Streptomyces europaeiscabiei TaxID=146819 RepID=A0ABU4N7F2_9ACTN|nr:FxsB family cyclophane-forming radical SAM/SPASM peptide maturase [Streptomyces europaeiscabiei]MDX3541796.1 FxsB family radical SAM/SPASM domain protein [Streptomyces europaeiscabiei]MDX3550789.1 FxsB family radical SAM/SPASM domain protein [Streptomyces europaeiscabiei]MDX3665014.1 FxsB family radical SAM/SPASM domain protein [Streptomyces europaeiscabiei]MDX3698651.1 FxsB family radical SAM/SPASM domain protein [Streptomyces europaeiscabiei]MDX3842142.1 FxsB family radical SAM/SPASM doma
MTVAARPFRQFVIKVHSRCDLACDHCYVYQHADQSWRGRPGTMSEQTFRRTADRIAEHATAHRLTRVHVVLHGGEPLLAGRERLRGFARALRSALHGVAELDLRMQTNGLRLDDEFCAMLVDESIVTSISLDGDEASNDRHRIRRDGSGSYRDVVRAVRLLGAPAHRSAFGGLLCTIDVENDPVEVYRALAELRPPAIDFLLPHATWEYPPPRPGGRAGSEYADWLIAVHKQWTADGMPMRIRMFESISRLSRGRGSLTEALGLGSSDLLVVETDGAVEQADWLKTAYPGAPATGMHIATHRLEEAAEHRGIQARRAGLDGLSAQCRACPVVSVCGGGLYGHRHRASNGFDNPSVYCADLLKTIEYVQATERNDADVRHGWHGLSWTHFDELAAGHGSTAAVRSLAAAQNSQRRALLAAAHRADTSGPGSDPGLGAGTATGPRPDPGFDPGIGGSADSAPGWEAVLALPAAALDVLLADPYLRVWALACGQSVRRRAEGRPAEAALSSVARTGGRLTLAVPLRHGPEGAAVHLPGVGRLLLRGDSSDRRSGTLTVTAEDSALTVEGRTLGRERPPDGMTWQPLRHLSTDGPEVALDDLDPARDCYGYKPLPRLPEAEFRRWEAMFAEAWQLIRTEYPDYAQGIAAGLTAVTPLAPAPSGDDVSATSRHAFGAVGIALPRSAEDLALLLIHEYQHVKLGAMLDMFDLLDGLDDRRHHVLWRPDPRPLDAIVQGAYAHLAVADVWRIRVRRGAAGVGTALYERSRVEADTWRTAVLDALDTVAGTGSLTALGHRFVRGLRGEAEALGGVAETGPIAV